MEALAPIAAQLGIDHTILYMFGLVVVLYAVISITYLKPFQHLLHERKQKTSGAKQEAESLKTQAEKAFEEYRERLRGTNEKSRDMMRASEDVARKEEAKILGDAANKAKTALQQTQADIEAQRKATIDALSTEIAGIAGEIASKALGRPVNAR